MPSARLGPPEDLLSETRTQRISLRRLPPGIQKGEMVRVIMTGKVISVTDDEGYSDVGLEASNVEFEPLTLDGMSQLARTRIPNPTIPTTLMGGAGGTGPSL